MMHHFRNQSPAKIAGKIICAICGGAALLALFGLLVMMVWNCIMPAIFGLKIIGFWQGLGLVLLARLLVGGHFGRCHHHRHKGCGWSKHKWSCGEGQHHCHSDDRDNDLYEKFWNEEGKAAFEAYLAKRKEN